MTTLSRVQAQARREGRVNNEVSLSAVCELLDTERNEERKRETLCSKCLSFFFFFQKVKVQKLVTIKVQQSASVRIGTEGASLNREFREERS